MSATRPGPSDGGEGGVQFFARVRSESVTDPFGNNDLVGLAFGISPVTYVRDLELTIRSPSGLFPAGSVGAVDLSFTNHGPDNDPTTTKEITVSDPFLVSFGDDPRGVRFALASTEDSDCTVSADDIDGSINQRTLQIDFQPVVAGTTRTCTLMVRALAGAVGRSTLRFVALGNHPGEVDPVPGNNSAFMLLQHDVDAVAVPALSLRLLVVTTLLLLVSGGCFLRSTR